MKIGLINAPCTYKANPVIPDMTCLNGIAYIGAELEKAGHCVKTLDYVHNHSASLGDVADCGVVGVTSILTCYDFLKQTLPELKRGGKTIVVGGPLISSYGLMDNLLMRVFPSIDYGVIGEGERTMIGLVNHLEGKAPMPSGIVYAEDGEIKNTGMGEVVAKLDDLAEVDWSDWGDMAEMAKGGAFNIMLSRGCYNHCDFCFKLGKGVRAFSWGRAKREIEKVAALQPRMISYGDDVFAYNPERAIEIARFTQELGFQYVIETRIEDLKESVLRVFKETGCQQVQIGVESFDDNVLKRAGKNQTSEEIYAGIERVQEAGIKFSAFILIGLPGETRKSLDATIKGVRETGIRARPRIVVPLPGTGLYAQALREGRLDEFEMLKAYSEPEHYDTLIGDWIPVNFTELPDEELLAARDRMSEIVEGRF